MTVKMVAIRAYYDKAKRVEYKTGAPFTVANDAEADRLERLKKARRDSAPVAKAQPQPLPAVQTKVMTPEDLPAAAVEAERNARQPRPRANRYRRDDMRAEE